MPPKKRPKNAAKGAVPKEAEKNTDIPDEDTSNGENPLHKFERELTWCIEQLQLGLETQNPDSRQAMEATKVLKILVSSKAPLIKKRQVMRNTFGDYRKKMQEQDRKSAAVAKKMKLLPVEDKGHQLSQFFRKSTKKVAGDSSTPPSGATQSAGDSVNSDADLKDVSQNQNETSMETTSNDTEMDLQTSFKFKFKLTDDDADTASGTNDTAGTSHVTNDQSQMGTKDAFKMNQSDNAFRFNFSVTDEPT